MTNILARQRLYARAAELAVALDAARYNASFHETRGMETAAFLAAQEAAEADLAAVESEIAALIAA
jgi:hypothetical protein